MALLLLPCHKSRLADLENHENIVSEGNCFFYNSFFLINYRIIIIIKFLSTVASNDTTKEQSSGPVSFFFSFGREKGMCIMDRIGSGLCRGEGILRIIPTYR